MARAVDEELVTFASASTAVALVSRLVLAPDVSREDVLGDSDPAEVLAAMEVVAAGVLAGLQPRDKGAAVLGRVGLGLADLERAQ